MEHELAINLPSVFTLEIFPTASHDHKTHLADDELGQWGTPLSTKVGFVGTLCVVRAGSLKRRGS